MVHLNRVATEKEVKEAKGNLDALSKFTLAVEDEPEDYTATVYGSKYAAEDLPRHDMPVRLPCYFSLLFTDPPRTARCHLRCESLSLQRETRHMLIFPSAYRLIKDDLTLDGTPTLNLASFVTTYMVSGFRLAPMESVELHRWGKDAS